MSVLYCNVFYFSKYIRIFFRALYLSDNEFEHLDAQIGNLKNLRILAIRDNELVDVPQEIGELQGLRELHLQGNRLTVLPPSLGGLDFLSSRSILKLDNNPWVPPIEDQLMLGVSHVIEYIRTGDRGNMYIIDYFDKTFIPQKPTSICTAATSKLMFRLQRRTMSAPPLDYREKAPKHLLMDLMERTNTVQDKMKIITKLLLMIFVNNLN